MADVLGVLQAAGLADEAALPCAVRQLHLAQAQRRRDAGEEGAQLAARQLPYFHHDGHAALGDPDHTRPKRRAAGQGMQSIVGRALGGLDQFGAALLELPIERQAIQVRTTDHQARAVVARDAARRARVQATAAGQRQPGLALQTVGQAQQVLIGEGAAEQGHAPGQAVLHKAGRRRDGGIVEHVHEVGVVAQVGIALDRLGVQLGEGHRARVGRAQHAIEVGHDAVADGFQRLQAVLGAE